MQAGKLDRRITIQSQSASQDGAGEAVATWAVVDTVWAQVIGTSGSEPFQGEQFNAQRKVTFVIRYRTDIDETNRIVYGGETYGVTATFEIGRRELLEVQTLALVTA